MIGTKLCRACGKIKPLTDFHKNKSRKDGVQTQCKECTAKLNAQHYQEHKEHHRQVRAKYYQTHRKEVIAKHRAYYKSHKIEKKAYGQKYYQEHKEQHNVYKRWWRAHNKDKIAAYARKSKLNPVKNEKSRLLKVVRRVFDHQGLSKSPTTERVCKCTPMELYQHLCQTWEQNYGQPYNGEQCEIDHITPLKMATTIEEVYHLYHYTNLQLLTKEDNRDKG